MHRLVGRGSADRGLQRPAAIVLALCFAALSCTSCIQQDARRFQSHVDYLASDALEGRGVGTSGIQAAAEYIAKRFAQAGLEPGAQGGSWFQPFPMTLDRKLTGQGRLQFNSTPTLTQERDFVPLSFSSNDRFEGSVSWCGYGIIAKEKDYDDFGDADFQGRVALMLIGEPASWADVNGFGTRHSLFVGKIYNAKDRGASAIVFVNPVELADDGDVLTPLDFHAADQYGIPVFHVKQRLVDETLRLAGLASLAELQSKTEARNPHDPPPGPLPGFGVSGEAGFEDQTASAKNVVGVLRGGKPDLGNVVVGAHYDHLGVRRPMMRTFRAGKLVKHDAGPEIHNGADDNASGTSGLIEIARMFVRSGRPERDVYFVAFSGEEAGLHGSTHYVKSPPAPLDSTIAMLNMDMIGRMPIDSKKVQVFGAKTSPAFMPILEAHARELDLEITPAVDEGGRSDHAPFVRKNIPALHFFTGHHSDYHKPSDDSEKINAAAGMAVARLVHMVANDLANAPDRPSFTTDVRARSSPTGATSYRVVMGISPGYIADEQPGMPVEAVTPQGPADLAGMKSGDRIIRINGKSISNIYDYMASTRGNNAGDAVEVVILRGGFEITLRVILSGTKS